MPLWRRRAFPVLSVLFWAVLVGVSLSLYLAFLDEDVTRMATARARILFNIVETARLWNAERGGLYALADQHTPPNPYIRDPDRDIEVNGRVLTKVNPAYMTRQIAELLQRQRGVQFHITSLKPIRPANAADAWETKMLQRFDQGAREGMEWQEDRDDSGRRRPSFRYMAALMVTEPCLQCHANQGYKVGDVRGGLSVTIPSSLILADILPSRRRVIILHAAAFLILSMTTIFFLRRLRRQWDALEHAKTRQEEIVEMRTAQLSDTVQALRVESEERLRLSQTLQDAVNELERIALFDGLTGLPTRVLFLDRLASALNRAERDGTSVCLTYVDLNDFKPVNDCYGHAAGDLVLQVMARRMEAAIRKTDTVARLGGDEFVVLLAGINDDVDAYAILEKIEGDILSPVDIGPNSVTVEASLGSVFYPVDGSNAEELLAKADAAMYAAKRRQKSSKGDAGQPEGAALGTV